ncbi:signal-transducing adaptor protein 2 isoform 2-T2 [Hipposideros larvatus]|uniref:Signal-transducing adaptor protein 2 isoform X2 n=1 Tax=Hipposideros armiger TaxID=186990 RepID=A0A8B7S6P6_HIPAR|nr:PREDICTED: signal-transducing adaptor protein 2 isoform X2 [Hipposideros armiger]
MASTLSPPRIPKPKCSLPSHYYENFLEKKGPYDQDYKKFWTGLQGLTLYFYNSNRDSQYMEKLDLGTFVKLTDEAPWGTSHEPGTRFNLVLRNQEIKFKVDSLESREMWKGFILTVVELRVPFNLILLPGHLYMMAEALAKEEVRRSLVIPSCFLKVSRLEAQLLLERYPECGNLLLRPSGDGAGGVSVTTRQTLNGTPVIRHYKVKREGPTYVIDVEEPFSCASLDAVVNYFVSHTKKALVPFLLDEDYEKVLGYVEADKENGENLWAIPSVPAVPSPVPSTGRLIVLKPKKCPAAPKVQAKPPKPPTAPKPEPRGLPGGLAKKLAVSSAQAFFPTTGLADVTAELEEKLQKRRALEHSAGLAEDQRANLRAWHISQANPSSQN